MACLQDSFSQWVLTCLYSSAPPSQSSKHRLLGGWAYCSAITLLVKSHLMQQVRKQLEIHWLSERHQSSESRNRLQLNNLLITHSKRYPNLFKDTMGSAEDE